MKFGTVYTVKVKHVAKHVQNLAFLYTVTKYCAGFVGVFFLHQSPSMKNSIC